jgi:hypothetical protein
MEHSYNIKDQTVFPTVEGTVQKKKDVGEFLSSLPGWGLFALIVIGYTMILGLGNYTGYQRFLAGVQHPAPPTDAAVGSVLALLAFLMSFAFSSTWTRFIRRNVYVVAHARAIGVCYLRASLITEVQKLEVRKLLHEYTNILLGIQTTADLEAGLPRINDIHLLLWRQTALLVKEEIDSELRSLFTSSINDLMTLAMERKTIALFIRIPNAIWNTLLILGAIAMAAFGYQAGVDGTYNLIQIPLLPVAFGLVIVLIADLHSRDSRRQFQVTRRPLKEVLEMMANEIP